MSTLTLDAFLASYAETGVTRLPVAQTIREIAAAGRRIWSIVQDGASDAFPTVQTGTNSDGDQQTALDIVTDRIFLDAARAAPVAAYASEELDLAQALDPEQPLALAIDPLDGSSNVNLNLSFGTIFSILPSFQPQNGPLASFLRPGANQLAAGLLVYGPRLSLVLSVGEGAHIFEYSDRIGGYRLVAENVRVPATAKEFAINASNYRHWDESVRLYFDDCVRGVHGPRERDYNMRWLASLVVEAYRILVRGGVFLYPGDKRPGYGNGRLRLVYEANPVAFLMEQAGGRATNGIDPILSVTPESLHQRTPLIFGAGREVAKLTRYHTDPSPIGERSALFGQRGLFRS